MLPPLFLQRSSILTMNLSKNFQVLPWKGGDDIYEDVLFKPKIKLLTKNTHWILKPKVWDNSKQDTFWDGRQEVSGLFGKYYLLITSWLNNDLSNKSFFQSIQVKCYHHTWKIWSQWATEEENEHLLQQDVCKWKKGNLSTVSSGKSLSLILWTPIMVIKNILVPRIQIHMYSDNVINTEIYIYVV